MKGEYISNFARSCHTALHEFVLLYTSSEEHHTSSDGGALAPGGRAFTKGQAQKGRPASSGRHRGRPAAEPAPSHPAETRKDEVKLVCRPVPRNQGALGSPDPSESHLHHPGTRARLLERLSTGGGRMQAEPASHGGATAPWGSAPAEAGPGPPRGGSGSRIPLFRFRFPEG